MAKKKRGNVVVYGILILIIAGLGGLGATNFGGGSTAVATVGDTDIDINDYARAIDREIGRFQDQTGQRLTFAQAQGIGFDRIALARLVQAAALEEETKELGLSVGDETVRDRILEVGAFQGAGGFDRDAYEFALRQAGLTVKEFEADIRAEATSNLLSAAVSSGLDASDTYVDTLYAFARETRDVSWVRLGEADLASEIPEPTDEELRAFHAENASAYVQPEARVIDYALVTPEDIAPDLEVTEDQARALYEERLEDFVQPARRLVERLVFPSEDAAAEAKAGIDGGETSFDELVAGRGLSLDDIDMGEITEAALGDAGAAVFALEEPGIAGPAPSSLGPALYRVNAILEAREVPFEDVRDELAEDAALDRARRVIVETGARIEDLLAGGASVEDIAEKTELTAGRIEFDGEGDEGIAGYLNFRDAAQTLTAGDLPRTVEMEDGALAVVSLAEIIPSRELEFDAAREAVLSDWRARATEDALRKQAQSMVGAIAEGVEETPLTETLELGRTGFVEGTPPEFVDTVFEMEVGESRILSADGEVWLLLLGAINDADSEDVVGRLARDRFRDETTQTLATDVMNAFTSAIIAERNVTVNQSALNAVHAQMQ